jgi:hypothetical protein
MIKYESNMLVLDPSVSKQEAMEIYKFVEAVREEERNKMLEVIDSIESQSHQTRTPIYQETMFRTLREKLNNLS